MRRFLAASYRADLALTDARAFAWQYRASGGFADVACAWDGERLVGTMGYVAFPAFWGSSEASVPMAWLANWMVDPAYRQGAGFALLRAMQERFEVLAAFGATAENERLVELLGWSLHPRVARRIAVLDAPACMAFALPNADPAQLAAAAIRPVRAGGAVHERRDDDPEIDWSWYAAARFGTVRSRAYLRWRYREHPAFRYTLVAAGPPERPALAVFRIEGVQGTTATVGRIVEFVHPGDAAGRNDGRAVLGAVAAHCAERGCAFVEAVGTSAEIDATLVAAGWTGETPGAEMLPGRFRPPERRAFALNLEIGARGRAMPPLGDLYITRGDGDADRASTVGDLARRVNQPD